MTALAATAPGKLMLAGEYAVLDGASALVVAVDRRAIARVRRDPRGSSALTEPGPVEPQAEDPKARSQVLVALADELTRRFGGDDARTRRAMTIEVDSSRLFHGAHKLGLGSSAATTVAACALALGTTEPRDELVSIAQAAHAAAQTQRGAAGSGADIAACAHGGVIEFARDAEVKRLAWPRGVRLLAFFTQASADTPELVARLAGAQRAHRAAVDGALAAIASASRAACLACAARSPELAASSLLAALALASHATDQLATASQVALVPPCVHAVRDKLAPLGGTAKTTGAGGGDVAIAVLPAATATTGPEDATHVTRWIIEAGGVPLDLALDETGVDLRPDVP